MKLSNNASFVNSIRHDCSPRTDQFARRVVFVNIILTVHNDIATTLGMDAIVSRPRRIVCCNNFISSRRPIKSTTQATVIKVLHSALNGFSNASPEIAFLLRRLNYWPRDYINYSQRRFFHLSLDCLNALWNSISINDFHASQSKRKRVCASV